MATIIDETFEGAADGVALTSGNTAFTSIVGTAVFDDAFAMEGTRSVLVSVAAAAAYGREDFTAIATVANRLYIRFAAWPAATTFVMFMQASTTTRAGCRVNADGTVTIRNGSTAVATTTAVLAINTWYRIEWVLDNGATTQQLKVFTGHGTTALSGGDVSGAFNTGTIDNVRVGSPASATWDFNIDDYRADDVATFIGPSGSAPSNWTYSRLVTIG